MKQLTGPRLIEKTTALLNEGAGGRFFTPASAAQEAIKLLGWLPSPEGLLDPTCGEGNLLQAALEVWGSACPPLFGYEIFAPCAQIAKLKLRTLAAQNQVNAPQVVCRDFLADPQEPPAPLVRQIFGNPPWVNFSNLDNGYKEILKPLFARYGLIGNKNKLLLGQSKVDVCALVIAKALVDHLLPGGEAAFFAPLSLLGPGAHETFQHRFNHGQDYRLREVWDYGDEVPFTDVGTAHGLMVWEKAPFSALPLIKRTKSGGLWTSQTVGDFQSFVLGEGWSPLKLPPSVQPRQGVNACGAHQVFVFTAEQLTQEDAPDQRLLYPLCTRRLFLNPQDPSQVDRPELWILLPYTPQGKPLLPEVLQRDYPKAWSYLLKHQDALQNRRGTIIQTQIKRGFWYALIGVGPYTFMPFKILWESYGKKYFAPRLLGPYVDAEGLEKPWIANQSLHGYLSFCEGPTAERILGEMAKLPICEVLTAYGGAGQPSWAQPGRMKVFFELPQRQALD